MGCSSRCIGQAGAFCMYRGLAHQAAEAQRTKLPGHSEAQIVVVVQIGFFLLALNALALLELSPGRAALVAAILIVGTGTLTGQHKNDSSQLVVPWCFRIKKQRQTLGWTQGRVSSPESAAGRGRRRGRARWGLELVFPMLWRWPAILIPPSSEGKLTIL